MAEVAKAAEALVDSVIKAAEDAVHKDKHGGAEAGDGKQEKSSSEPEGAGPSQHKRQSTITQPHTIAHITTKVDCTTQTTFEGVPQEPSDGQARPNPKIPVSMKETVEVSRPGARSTHRASQGGGGASLTVEQVLSSTAQCRLSASPAPTRASLLRASSLSASPSINPRASTTSRSASPPRRSTGYYYFEKFLEEGKGDEEAEGGGLVFSDRPNPRPLPYNPTLPSVPSATWPDPNIRPRFPSPTPAPAPPPTPPSSWSAARPGLLCSPPVASDLYKWDPKTPRFAPLHLHRSGPDQTPPPAPRPSNFHKWSLTAPRFASPPGDKLLSTAEPNLNPVPPPLSPQRVRDWAKLPTPDRFRPSYKPMQRPRRPYPNYIHKQRATRQATPAQDTPQEQSLSHNAPAPAPPSPQQPAPQAPPLSTHA